MVKSQPLLFKLALDEKWARFMALGFELLYLGQQEASDATLETLKAIEHNVSKHYGH